MPANRGLSELGQGTSKLAEYCLSVTLEFTKKLVDRFYVAPPALKTDFMNVYNEFYLGMSPDDWEWFAADFLNDIGYDLISLPSSPAYS